MLQRVERDSTSYIVTPPSVVKPKVCAKGDAICIPSNYSKFDLPNETLTTVNVGIDIKDIPKIDDKEFSITLNAFFVVRWTDERMIIDQVSLAITVQNLKKNICPLSVLCSPRLILTRSPQIYDQNKTEAR